MHSNQKITSNPNKNATSKSVKNTITVVCSLRFGGVGLGGGEGGELSLGAALSAAADDLDRLHGLVVAGGDRGALDRPDGAHAVEDLAEDDVLAVEPGRLDGGDEELASVGVLAGVGHGEPARAVVVQLEVLVGELLAVDRPTPSAVAPGEVSALDH